MRKWPLSKTVPAIPQKLLLCYEGFSIFSAYFTGNKNVIQANISKSITVIKNRGYGFILLFILTSWSQKQLKHFVASWSWSSNLVIKCTKCNANFTPFDKMSTYPARNIQGIFAVCSLSVAIFGTSKQHLRNILKEKIF